MTYEQFWHGDLEEYYSYLQAYQSRRDSYYRDMDINAWNVGKYVINAIKSTPVLPLGLLESKDLKKVIDKYPTKPYSIIEQEKEENERKSKLKHNPPTQAQINAYNLKMQQLRLKNIRS